MKKRLEWYCYFSVTKGPGISSTLFLSFFHWRMPSNEPRTNRNYFQSRSYCGFGRFRMVKVYFSWQFWELHVMIGEWREKRDASSSRSHVVRMHFGIKQVAFYEAFKLGFEIKRFVVSNSVTVDLNPSKTKSTRSWVRNRRTNFLTLIFGSGTKYLSVRFLNLLQHGHFSKAPRDMRKFPAEVPEDSWVLRVRHVWFPTSDRLKI